MMPIMSRTHPERNLLAPLAAVFAAGALLVACDQEASTPQASAQPAAHSDGAAEDATPSASTATAPGTSVPLPGEDAGSSDAGRPMVPRRPVNPGGGSAGQPSASDGGAQIQFQELVHDFGTVWDLELQKTEFAFTNVGDDVLIVEDIKASCGCTATKLDKRRYEPGEGAAIGVEFDAKGKGRQRKTIDVITNSASQPLVRLAIEADVRQFISIDPAVVQFNEIQLAQPHSKIVAVSSADPSFEIQSVGTYGEHVHAELIDSGSDLGPRRPGEPAPKPMIRVTIDEDAPWGALYGSIAVTGVGVRDDTGERITHTQRASVLAKVYGTIHADKTTLGLGQVRPGDSFSKSIRLWSPSGEPFELDARLEMTRFEGAELETRPIEIAGRPGYELTVSGDVGSHIGGIQGAVIVTTDIPGEERLEFRVAGLVRQD